jgi:hypothetical protein
MIAFTTRQFLNHFSMHEHSQKHIIEVKGSSDRAFGLVFSAVFAIIALYPLLGSGTIRSWSLIVAGIFLLLALITPVVLAPANRLWMKFGELLHRIVSPVALGIVFYVTVLPTGILLRLLGKDPLRLRIDPTAKSYWILREPPGPAAESLNNQF